MSNIEYSYNIHARRLRAMLRKVQRGDAHLHTSCPAAKDFSTSTSPQDKWADDVFACNICRSFVGLQCQQPRCPCHVLKDKTMPRSWEALETYFTTGQLWKPPARAEDREQVTITRHIIEPALHIGIGWYAVKEWNHVTNSYLTVSTHRGYEQAEEAIAKYEGRR